LKNEQEELKEEQKKLLTDTTHIEDLARDLFRMAQPKEKVFKTLPRSED
jgi:cell division protein FtsB